MVRSRRSLSLQKQITAVLAQPIDVWATGFGHTLANIQWPDGCSAYNTWLWSTVIHEQAEVLVRAGVSARRIAQLVTSHEKTGEQERLTTVSGMMHQPLESKLFEWLHESDAYPHAALGVTAAAWHLDEHSKRMDPEILSRWVSTAATQIDERRNDRFDCLLGNLVLHCELPLLFDLLSASRRRSAGDIASHSMDCLAEYLENSQEHAEAWLAHGAGYLRAALGCVFRCRVVADHLGLRRWYPPQRKSLAGLLEHAARWARPDGTQLLGYSAASSSWLPIWKALGKQASAGRSVRSVLALAGLIEDGEAIRRKKSDLKLPALAHESDRAQCASMRRSWYRRGCSIAVDFSEATVQLETLGPKGTSLLKGAWPVNVTLGGELQYQMDGWDPVCWFSDDDVDYLEIEARFGEMARVQRQLILFRKQRLVMAADALRTQRIGDWTIESEIPLAPSIEYEASAKNTEGFLVGKGLRCLVVALFLPEWRAALSTGSMKSGSSRIVVRNSTHGGSNVFAPVIISLRNRTANQAYTWRHLTVAEDLSIVPRDQAVAYRFQSGKKQILFYRNLANVSKRTVLGVHLLSDFFAGLFDKDSGEASTLVEIDANG